MLILHDYIYDHTEEGWSAKRCPECCKIRAFKVESVTKIERLYFIPVNKKPNGVRVSCHFCNADWSRENIDIGQISFTTNWSPEQPLQALADLTKPGRIITEDEDSANGIAQEEIQNLLSTIDLRMKTKLKGHGGMSGLLGLFISVMLSLYLAAKYQIAGTNSLYLWIGTPLLGVIIGAVLGRAVVARQFAKKEINTALTKHHLSPADLSRQLTSTGKEMPLISKQLERMAR